MLKENISSVLHDLENITFWGRVEMGETPERLATVNKHFVLPIAHVNREDPEHHFFLCSVTTTSI